MTEITDLSGTDASNTLIGGFNITDNLNIDDIDNVFRVFAGMLGRQFAQGSIASASTTDLSTKPEQYINVTGTTTITGFGTVKAGTIKYLRFDGALTLTHNGTSLILPGGVNITTAANDIAVMISEGSGNWRCANYQRRASVHFNLVDEDDMSSNSAILVPSQQSVKAYVDNGGPAPYKTSSPSAVSSVIFTGLPTSVRVWRLELINMKPTADNENLYVRASASGTPVATGYEAGVTRTDYNSASIANSNVTSAFLVGATVGNDTNESCSATVTIHGLGQSQYTFAHGTGVLITPAAGTRFTWFGGALKNTTAYTELAVLFGGSNIVSGEIRLYAVRDA